MQAKDSTFIDDMTKMIIRPRRDLYPIDKLGTTLLKKALRSSSLKAGMLPDLGKKMLTSIWKCRGRTQR